MDLVASEGAVWVGGDGSLAMVTEAPRPEWGSGVKDP